MKTYKKILRIWITIASFISFLTGWVFISRATKIGSVTYVGNTAVVMPTFQSIPALGDTTSNNTGTGNVQVFTVNTAPQTSRPMFRTGGS